MKKILFAVLLIAGTTFGFAKDNVQNLNSNELSYKTEFVNGKKVQIYKFASKTDAEKFLAQCMDVHGLFEEVEVPDGNGGTYTDYEYIGTIEVTYECENGGVNLYIWIF